VLFERICCFFLILLALGIESSFGSFNLIWTVFGIVRWHITVHKLLVLPIAGTGIPGFGRKGALNPCTNFHKSHRLSNPEKWCRSIHLLINIDTARITPIGLSVDLQQIPGSRGSFAYFSSCREK